MQQNSLKETGSSEILILACLKRNNRNKKRLFPAANIQHQLESQKERSVIRCNSSLDFRELGYAIKAKIRIPENKRLLQFFTDHPNTTQINHKVNGQVADSTIEMSFQDKKKLNQFLILLENKYKVRDKVLFTIAEDIRREGFLYRDAWDYKA